MKGYICPAIKFELDRVQPSKVKSEKQHNQIWVKGMSLSWQHKGWVGDQGNCRGGNCYFVAKVQAGDGKNFNHDVGSSQEEIE